MRRFVVEVVVLVGWDDLDAEDVDDEGECIVDGAWLVEAVDEVAALDRFHHTIPIACLDDFLISVRPFRPADGLMSFRERL